MKYYIISGEASGDLHGSNLIKELKKKDNAANFRCWGGDLMEAEDATIVKHYKELAFMGFIEVVKNLPVILKNIAFCKKDISNYHPDVLILIDYPGFNLRIAKWAKEQGFKVVYYISPQIWAWKESRIKLIKKCVDRMLVILPFEKDFYKKWNYPVDYVGNPLAEFINEYQKNNLVGEHPENIIALLPGSRKQEIKVKLPLMLEASKHFNAYQFVVAKAPGIELDFYDEFLQQYKNVNTSSNKTYDLLLRSKAALVTSGTATLETALFGVPQVICYKGSNISYQIAKRLIKIKYIGLVNLIMNKEVVKELIQDELTTDNIVRELEMILYNQEKQQQIEKDYTTLKRILSEGGNASENAAEIIFNTLKN
jgi:lipid-A-disaccharide synthase